MADPLWGRLRHFAQRATNTGGEPAGRSGRIRGFVDGWTLQISAWGATNRPESNRDREARRSRPDIAATIGVLTAAGLADVDVNPCPDWDGEPALVVSGRSSGTARAEVFADAEKAAAIARDTFPVPDADRVVVRIRSAGSWIEHWTP